MNAREGHSKSVDHVITSVLREDEHPALLATFGLKPSSEPNRRVEGIEIWDTELKRNKGKCLNVALTCLGDKGTADSILHTKKILDVMNPKSIYLVGTAAGRKNRTSICDVVVSCEGIMYYESGRPRGSGIGSKPKYVSPRPSTQKEARAFYAARMKTLGWENEYKSILQNLQKYKEHGTCLSVPVSEPEVHFDMIASGEKLLNEEIMESICTYNDSVRAGDMEGYGFAMVCNESEADWLVIRGISDFGSREDREKWKTTATVMACSFLKILLKHTTPPERLPENLLYVREKIPDIVRQVLKEKSIDIASVKLTLGLTISELERICHILYPAISSEQLKKIVREARATAFERKYAARTEEDDERFRNIEEWKAEFRSLLSNFGISDLNTQSVINVGIGNGLEAKGLLDDIGMFTGVDISAKALEQAKQRCPRMRCIVNDAEELCDVANSSQDVYISLRTYQSTLFDINSALLEACRILKPGGIIVVSIPNFYTKEDGGIVRGLLLPESDEVDPDLPYILVDNIRKMLNSFNFDRVGIRTGMVEVYVYGQRGTII